MAVTLGFIGVGVGAGTDDTVSVVSKGLVGLVLLLPLTGACKWPKHSPSYAPCSGPNLSPSTQGTAPGSPTAPLHCAAGCHPIPKHPLLFLPG